MIVITMTKCPPKLHGGLSKWLQEIDTGVFVGNLSARVRDELWDMISEHVNDGRVTMLYTTKNAQGYAIKTINTSWTPIEFDGITLMQHPLPPKKKKKTSNKSQSVSKKRTRRIQIKENPISEDYIVVDLETTGLNALQDDIIEIAAIHIQNHNLVNKYTCLVKTEKEIPNEIVNLTEITNEMLEMDGISQRQAIEGLLKFIDNKALVIHNAKFDLSFLNAICTKLELPIIHNEYKDTLQLCRRMVSGLENYRLKTIAEYFDIDLTGAHRALNDSMITMNIFEKLNNLSDLPL